LQILLLFVVREIGIALLVKVKSLDHMFGLDYFACKVYYVFMYYVYYCFQTTGRIILSLSRKFSSPSRAAPARIYVALF